MDNLTKLTAAGILISGRISCRIPDIGRAGAGPDIWPDNPACRISGTSLIIGHITIRLLYVFSLKQLSVSHGFCNTKTQRHFGHDLDLLGSHDIISHVTIGLLICSYVLVVNFYQPPVSHSAWDIKFKDIAVTAFTFLVEWHHQSRDH